MSDTTAKRKRSRLSRSKSVTERRVQTSDGRIETILVVDAASPTFGEDMLYVFRRNVAAARRENKRVTGFSDFVPSERDGLA